MDCADAVGVLAVVAVLASIATIVMTTTSVLLLWKPHLFPKLHWKKGGQTTSGFASAQSGTKHRELDLRPSPQPSGSITTATTSTLQLTTIEEVEEISPPPPTPEKTDYSTEVIRNSGAEREGKGEGEGEGEGEREKEVFGEESGSVPSTPITSDSGERVRKRSRVSLSSLAGSLSSKLGGLNPRRVSSGGHTVEEVTDLMMEREERNSSPSSEEGALEYRDSIFGQGSDHLATGEGDRGRRQHRFVLDLHYDHGESAV